MDFEGILHLDGDLLEKPSRETLWWIARGIGKLCEMDFLVSLSVNFLSFIIEKEMEDWSSLSFVHKGLN